MARIVIPGDARSRFAYGRLPSIRDVVLAAGSREARADALLDTGSTYCVIPEEVAGRLNLRSDDRLGFARVHGVAGRTTTMERFRLEYVRAGTAQAGGVDILVGEAVFGLMLLGMSFIGKFTTTLDLDAKRAIFRPRAANRRGSRYP